MTFWFSGLDLLVAAFGCNNPDGLRTPCSAVIANTIAEPITGTNSARWQKIKKAIPYLEMHDLFGSLGWIYWLQLLAVTTLRASR